MAGKRKIVICVGSSCFVRGNAANAETVKEFLKERGLADDVDVDFSGGLCFGQCSEGPNVMIDGEIFHRVDRGVMLDLLNRTFPQT